MEGEVKFVESDFKHEFMEVSCEEVMFPKYRVKYIEQTEKYIVLALEKKKISCAIDFERNVISVLTNASTRDPFIFIKAVNFVKLVGRGVGVEEAMKVLEDECFCEVIDIKSLAGSEKVFEKRRDRLIGPKEMTLEAIRKVTGCYVLVHGKTVSVIGSFRGVEEVKEVVTKCMDNVHPIYQIKRLIEKRKLESDDGKKFEDWERYLPQATKKGKSGGSKMKKKVGRVSGGMPDCEARRKEDAEMETGEYFIGKLDDRKKDVRRREEREGKDKKRRKEIEKYIVPDEDG
ncbi:RNA-binding protein [Ordospora pajunii]|uniref:RNA-binding protein n=1 Tax=Ordospora pajunii TaxID=3039483 RepID=UPI00295289B8|nr:RNA-binding protein [Ordospora pajunii]KAH9411644.1 RNA-binding protein [Ordospora pajunii]